MSDNLVNRSLGELAGTFVLITVILNVVNNGTAKGFSEVAFPIGLALTVAILLFGGLSGGHFNPAVSLTMFFQNQTGFPLVALAVYVLAQAIGGMGALQWFKMLNPPA
jgi:glycerol uptake facilitator-like aquaporin